MSDDDPFAPAQSAQAESSQAQSAQTPSAQTPSPRAMRHSVMLGASIERFGEGKTTKHRIRDLSPGGVRIDQAAGLAVDATVLVTVGTLDSVGATVVWVKDGWAGLQFAREIDPAAARAKAAIAPRVEERTTTTKGSPSAGWIPNLTSPYKR